MNTYVCVLKSGGAYSPEHVRLLHENVRWALPNMEQFICLTDMDFEIPGVTCIPLERNYAGKWSMAEVYRMTGKVVVTGLDSIWVRQAPEVFELAEKTKQNTVWMIYGKGGQRTDYIANGIMIWNGDYSKVFADYKIKQVRENYRLEMRYAQYVLQELGVTIKILNKLDSSKQLGVYSYKRNIRGQHLPDDAKLVLFHGNPMPWKVNDKWIHNIRRQCKVLS